MPKILSEEMNLHESLMAFNELMAITVAGEIGGCKNCINFIKSIYGCKKELFVSFNEDVGYLVCNNWEKK